MDEITLELVVPEPPKRARKSRWMVFDIDTGKLYWEDTLELVGKLEDDTQ